MDTKVLEPLIGRWEIPVDGGEPGEAVFSVGARPARSSRCGRPSPSRARRTA